MGQFVTISTKVRKELKEEAERLGIKVSEVLRRALEEEVQKRKLKELEEKLNEMDDVLENIQVDRITKSIREDREAR